MSRLLVVVTATLLVAFCLGGSVYARSPALLYPDKIDLHFADAKGKVHRLAITINVEGPLVGTCMPLDEVAARAIAAQRKPELYVMAYLGSTCHGAPAPSNVSIEQPVDDRAAMVVLMYRDEAGSFHYSSFGRKKAGEYTMGTCPLVLKKSLATLRKQAEADHAGQEFRGADCFLRSVNLHNFQTH
jgi:hypothetical protein